MVLSLGQHPEEEHLWDRKCSYRRLQPILWKDTYSSRISESAAAKDNLTDRRQRQSDGLDEVETVERAKQGDAEAFKTLYNLHKRRVYSLCWRMTANTAEAEDLTQETFLQLFRKIGTFRGESAFSTWLHRMTVNVVLMHLRKKGLPVLSLEKTTDGEEDTPKKDFGTEDVDLAGSIDRLQLRYAIDRLAPGYRAIFVLHDVEGYEHNEIATMVGCSIGNSKSQLHKARMKLRDFLKMNRGENDRKTFRIARVSAVSGREAVRPVQNSKDTASPVRRIAGLEATRSL